MRRFIGAFVALLLLAAWEAPLAAADKADNRAQELTEDGKIQFWNLNTLHLCGWNPDGWDKAFDKTCRPQRIDPMIFVRYITQRKTTRFVPDLFALQELRRPDIEDRSCAQFERVMERHVGRDYTCIATDRAGGSTVAFRTKRFEMLRSEKIREYIAKDGKCRIAASWSSMMVVLRDKQNNHRIVVTSVHLPTTGLRPPSKEDPIPNDCAGLNTKLLAEATQDAGPARLRFLAGDWNHYDWNHFDGYWEGWYRCSVKGLTDRFVGEVPDKSCAAESLNRRWTDGALEDCEATSRLWKKCIVNRDHWTRKRNGQPIRIDFLFYQGCETNRFVTVPHGTKKRYSDHRGQGGVFIGYDKDGGCPA